MLELIRSDETITYEYFQKKWVIMMIYLLTRYNLKKKIIKKK